MGQASLKGSEDEHQQQPAVILDIVEGKIEADKRTQELIDELLAEDPASIKQEMRQIVEKQKQAGKWK